MVVHAQDVAQRKRISLGGEEGLDLGEGGEGDGLGRGFMGFGVLGRLDAHVKKRPACCFLQVAFSHVVGVAQVVTHFFTLEVFHYLLEFFQNWLALHNYFTYHVQLVVNMEGVVSFSTLAPGSYLYWSVELMQFNNLSAVLS